MTEYSAPPSKGDWKPVEPVRSSFARTTIYAFGWMYDWVNRVAWIVAALSVPFYLYVAFTRSQRRSASPNRRHKKQSSAKTSRSVGSTGCR